MSSKQLHGARGRLAASALSCLRLCFAVAALSAFAAPSAAADISGLTATCAACHGEDGHSQMPEIPSIGGQPRFYTLYQLFFFREGRRKNEEMNALLDGISDADMQELADYVSELPPPPATDEPVDKDRFCRGAQLAAEHICGSCHERDFSGREQSPRLAGQQEAYLVKTMAQYKAGERIGIQAMMPEVLGGIDADGIAALAHFFSRLPAEGVSCSD